MLMNSKSADILQTPSEPLLEYFGETTINNVKETAKTVTKEEVNNVIPNYSSIDLYSRKFI